jgi:hypothetical protein
MVVPQYMVGLQWKIQGRPSLEALDPVTLRLRVLLAWNFGQRHQDFIGKSSCLS